ncbi:MAG: c-type cytochrome [Pseudochelatococcus sp.]
MSSETTTTEYRPRLPGVRLLAVMTAICLLSPSGPVAQEAVDGRRFYDEACAGCHGRQGRETARGRARPLDTLSAEAVRGYLLAARAVEAPARPYQRLKKGLSDAEIEALVNYAAQFREH